jgi:hypothetical protein
VKYEAGAELYRSTQDGAYDGPVRVLKAGGEFVQYCDIYLVQPFEDPASLAWVDEEELAPITQVGAMRS